MKIAIVGAGIAGLSAAYRLSKQGLKQPVMSAVWQRVSRKAIGIGQWSVFTITGFSPIQQF